MTLSETDVITRGRVTGSNTFVAKQPTAAVLEMVVQVAVIQSLHWKAVPHHLYLFRNDLYLSNSLLSSCLTLIISVSLKVFGSLEKPVLITGYRCGAEAIWVDMV